MGAHQGLVGHLRVEAERSHASTSSAAVARRP